jgi:c(7)-type cytochrome triheme protein
MTQKHYIHRTRTLIACLAVAGLAGAMGLLAAQPPDKLTFATRNGNVTFDHAAHTKRANGDCSGCHDKLFKQDSKAPLNFKAAIHKTAEAGKTSCGACHNPGGAAFESKGNCAKCHVKS